MYFLKISEGKHPFTYHGAVCLAFFEELSTLYIQHIFPWYCWSFHSLFVQGLCMLRILIPFSNMKCKISPQFIMCLFNIFCCWYLFWDFIMIVMHYCIFDFLVLENWVDIRQGGGFRSLITVIIWKMVELRSSDVFSIYIKFLCSIMIWYMNVFPSSYMTHSLTPSELCSINFIRKVFCNHPIWNVNTLTYVYPLFLYFPLQQLSQFDMTHILLIYVLSFVLSPICWYH